MKVILGAGIFALSIGKILGDDCVYVCRDPQQVEEINLYKKNSKYHETYMINETHSAVEFDNFDYDRDYEIIFYVLPSDAYDSVPDRMWKKAPTIFCHKGLYKKFIYDKHKYPYGYLSGPSYANEILNNKRTCLVLASTDKEILKYGSLLGQNSKIYLYMSSNPKTIEILAISKNLISLMVGYLEGRKYSRNETAMIIVKYFNDLKRNVKFSAEELSGPAGFGDFYLSCNKNSRNYRFGYNLAQGNKVHDSTIESLTSLKYVYDILDTDSVQFINGLIK